MVESFGIRDYVDFIGWIPHNHVLEHLASAYCLLLPSHSEGAPKAVIEAMAAARPVIASSRGEIPNMVIDGETGYLVNPDSDGDISNKINMLLADNENARAFGLAGRARAQKWANENFALRIQGIAKSIVYPSKETIHEE